MLATLCCLNAEQDYWWLKGLKRALTPFVTNPCILYYSDSGVVRSPQQFRSKLL